MKRADVPPQRRRRERGREREACEKGKQEKKRSCTARAGKDILGLERQNETDGDRRTELSVAFLLKWKWSTERRGATLSELAATATNDVRGQTGVQLNMQ